MEYGSEFLAAVSTAEIITVTGPQRSGTRITTAMLAKDLGRTFIGEEDYRVSKVAGRFVRYLDLARSKSPCVVHAPTLAPLAHHLPGHVVFMMRELKFIQLSEQRIDWHWAFLELEGYFRDQGTIAEVRYDVWNRFQKKVLDDRAFELSYNSLCSHPMWIPKEARKTFHPHQIAPGAIARP